MSDFIVSPEGSPRTPLPRRTTSSSRALTLLWFARYFTIFPLALALIASISTEGKSSALLPTVIPTYGPAALPPLADTQNVQYRTSLIKDHLPAYLNFVSTEVLLIMSKNIDEILNNLQGLTDIRPDFFLSWTHRLFNIRPRRD